MNPDQHPVVAKIDADLRDLQTALRGAEQDRARMALQNLSGDSSTAKKLAQVEAEVSNYRADIDRLGAARRCAVDQAAAEHHGAKAEALQQHLADALAAARQRLEASKKLERAMQTFSDALAHVTTLGVASWAALAKTSELTGSIEAALALKDRCYGGEVGPIAQALHTAVVRAQECGSHLRIELPGFSAVHGSLVDAVTRDHERLQAVVAGWTVAGEATPAALTPAVDPRSAPLTKVINGTTQIVGVEGSQHV